MNNYMGLMDQIFTNGDGIGIASPNGGNRMKRNRQILKPRKFSSLSLGDLILAVSSCTSSNRETVATVSLLLLVQELTARMRSPSDRLENFRGFKICRFLFIRLPPLGEAIPIPSPFVNI